jgi:hypothetical protein
MLYLKCMAIPAAYRERSDYEAEKSPDYELFDYYLCSASFGTSFVLGNYTDTEESGGFAEKSLVFCKFSVTFAEQYQQ